MSSLRRPRASLLALSIALAAGLPLSAVAAKPAAVVDVPFEQFTLPNGLRVIVHTDRKAPIVAVNIWYHVGSKNEPAGRSGFAHLFEHLMFQGSENHRDEYFVPFKKVGVTDQNGTTNQDRTNYFQNVPTTAIDTALFMESDRMGHLLGAIDQAALDEQRGVVQNEKRQGENQPYGRVWNALLKSSYPAGHPYQHSVIGSMNDLNAAALEDVKTWFRSWYGPNNAVLVLAGDIDLATARAKAMQYFGDIPASASVPAMPATPAPRTQSTRETLTDNVPQTRIYKVWNTPQYGSIGADRLALFAQVLGGSGSSRLDQRLVLGDKIASSVSAFADASEIGGSFIITADVKEGVEAAKVEAAIAEELDKLLRDGPSADELAQASTVIRAGFVRGIERIGGFGGKADVLAECAVYTGDAGCFRDTLQRLQASTPAQVRDAGRQWLRQGDHTLTVVKGEATPSPEDPAATPAATAIPAADPKYTTVASGIDRSKGVPMPKDFPSLQFPALQRATLDNGLKIVLAERHDVPVVQMSLQLAGGFASDPAGKEGLASFSMGMLSEGAGEYDTIAFTNRAERLGANLGANAALDGASVNLSALKENLGDSLALYADMLQRPRFDAGEMERVRAQRLAGLQQEKARPQLLGQRLLPVLMFDSAHPYAKPLTGTGYEAAIKGLTREDLLAYHRQWVRPENATLVVVGDTNMAELLPLLQKDLGAWKGEGVVLAPAAPPTQKAATKSRVFLVDQPGAVQANIFAAQLLPASTDPIAVKLEFANGVFGGDFTSRLNMNLREQKHWSYGARSGLPAALGPRLWSAAAPVQIDKTAESAAEIARELSEYAGGKAPAKQEEVDRIRAIQVLSLPGSFETAAAVMGQINSNLRYGRPDNYVELRLAEVKALTPASVQPVAAQYFQPQALTWLIVGDLKKIEAGVSALKLGEVTVIDAEGKPAK
jgi:predicted Zn-dependent peptidase